MDHLASFPFSFFIWLVLLLVVLDVQVVCFKLFSDFQGCFKMFCSCFELSSVCFLFFVVFVCFALSLVMLRTFLSTCVKFY